jgi:predicted Rossmann fold flavoprotein
MHPSTPPHDAIILGGGAAGLMCALTAARRGRRVLLLEHNDAVGRKIRISGGGRCNFTNLHADPKRYLSSNPRFCHSALARYTPRDFVAYVESHGIAYHEKKLGQLFCDGSAQALIDALLGDCREAGVEIRVGCAVRGVSRVDDYLVETAQGTLRASAVVVATGGLSIPKLGASDLGYRIARTFDVPVLPCAPALVPLTLAPQDLAAYADLSGIAFPARATCGGISFDENVLITHRGLSGPAILQVSSYWNPGDDLSLNLFSEHGFAEQLIAEKRRHPRSAPASLLSAKVPARLAQRLCEAHAWSRPLGETPDAALRDMARHWQGWRIPIAGTEGYAKAEVTRGGVDTRALSPKTMEARHAPGLFFIGEVVDVTGWLGGYNFQWAWASAVAAGDAL